LVDSNPDAIKDPAFKRFQGIFLKDYQALSKDEVDAVVVATPNHTHFPIASHCLSQGLSTLVEKPVTLLDQDYQDLRHKQNTKGAIMQVGMVKRHLPVNRIMRDIFRQNLLGRLKAFHIEEGMLFNWPIRSLSFLDKAKAGGGVLIDNGIHILDLLFWWLQQSGSLPRIDDFAYYDDNQGGVESECRMQLNFENQLKGTCHFSRIRLLSQSWQLDFEQGAILIKNGRVFLTIPSALSDHDLINQLRSSSSGSMKRAFKRQLEGFHSGILRHEPENDPVIPYTIDLINRLYENRKTLATSYYDI
jgi:predicted dehydrogenase